MPSGFSPVKEALEAYVAGRVKAERLVVAVAAEYYRDALNGKREMLRPLIDVIDRASPGIVELGRADGGPGFEVRLVERPFPKQHEAELRRAAEAVLAGSGKRETGNVRQAEAAGVWGWIRRLFRGSWVAGPPLPPARQAPGRRLAGPLCELGQ